MKRETITASLLGLALLIGSMGCKKAFEDDGQSYNPDADKDLIDKVTNSDEVLDDIVAATIDESPSDYVFNLQTANKIIGKGATVAVEGKGATADGATATISQSGEYMVEGELTDGRLLIDLDKDDNGIVKLMLNNARYTSASGAALKIKTCPKVSILLMDDTYNVLESTTEADTSAALHSSQNIYLSAGEKQNGKLKVTSLKNQAIKSTDGIIIKSGNYDIQSSGNDGIQAKDFIIIKGGNISVNSAQHSIKTTSTKENKGFVMISGGELDLKSGNNTSYIKDAIHAEGSVNITGGSLKLESAGDGIYSGAHIVIKDGAISISQSDKCIAAMGNITIDGGSLTLAPTAYKTSSEEGAGHGITSKKTDSGTRIGNVTINGGTISITKAYEGIQGVAITINGGQIYINSLDDAINAGDGSSTQPGGWGQRPGTGGNTGTSSKAGLYINGGLVMVSAQGDGIDSNGELIITDGIVLVSQSGQGNEPIDSGDGCEPTIEGGVVIAAGAQGMASAPECRQTAFFAGISGQAGKYMAVNDPDGRNILAWKIPQAYQIITVSAPDMGTGTYTCIPDATISGTEYKAGTSFYYPAQSATGTGTEISLTAGQCTSSQVSGGMGGPGSRPGW